MKELKHDIVFLFLSYLFLYFVPHIVGQSRHVVQKPQETLKKHTQETSSNSTKQIPNDQKCEQVNLESTVQKNTVKTEEKKSESEHENSQSPTNEK